MNNIDLSYQKLLQDILDNGVEKKDRTGTGTISVFGRQIRHKMSEGFPLLTTKKMAWKSVVTELLWFLRGDTNIKYLVDNGCHIWDGDAYKNYRSKSNDLDLPKNLYNNLIDDLGNNAMFPIENPSRMLSQEEFINKIKNDDEFAKKWGELGPIYGKQWRKWEGVVKQRISNTAYSMDWGHTDQIQNLIDELKTNPDSRRLMVNAWNVGELDQMVLPPCHYGFQVYTRELSEKERLQILLPDVQEQVDALEAFGLAFLMKKSDEKNIPTRAISLMWNQRSVDTFLGLPFNIASYGLLLEIIAKAVNMVPDELIGNLGDVHLYSNHIEQAKEQIGRELTLEERSDIWNKTHNPAGNIYTHSQYDKNNIPTRTREPYLLPTLKINLGEPSIIEKPQYWKPEDFQIEDYQSHPAIKAPLSN